MLSGHRFRAWIIVKRQVLEFGKNVIGRIPYFRFIRVTANTQVPITLDMWWQQVVLGKYDGLYWPIHPTSVVEDYRNVLIGVHTNPGYAPHCYIQGTGGIRIGDYTQVSRNVQILTVPNGSEALWNDTPKSVRIGQYCWLGMHSVILPGVELGDFTIVAAGSVVTQSFSEGYCVLAGNPAVITRRLDPGQCVRYNHRYPYVGFVKKKDFESYRRRKLLV
ncbi:MAG: acyltransferase [Chitinophagia bacterium]|nr:acyltransferase [Chitinophagia bacterium]